MNTPWILWGDMPDIAFGIWSATVTPFEESGAVDHGRLASHAAQVLARGADGIMLFGTTGEGASVGPAERAAALDAVLAQGIPAGKLGMTVYGNSVAEAVEQAQAAARRGVTRLLVPPPGYFKGVSEAGLRAWFEGFLAGLPGGVQVIVYHIPQVTGVPLPPSLVAALHAAHPGRVAAVKDSAGNWANTDALLAQRAIAVLVGDERQFAKAARGGAAGTISGMANIVPDRLRRMLDTGEGDPALDALVDAVVALPVTPAVKALVAEMHGDAAWRRVRAPLEQTPSGAIPALASRLGSVLSPTEA